MGDSRGCRVGAWVGWNAEIKVHKKTDIGIWRRSEERIFVEDWLFFFVEAGWKTRKEQVWNCLENREYKEWVNEH